MKYYRITIKEPAVMDESVHQALKTQLVQNAPVKLTEDNDSFVEARAYYALTNTRAKTLFGFLTELSKKFQDVFFRMDHVDTFGNSSTIIHNGQFYTKTIPDTEEIIASFLIHSKEKLRRS